MASFDFHKCQRFIWIGLGIIYALIAFQTWNNAQEIKEITKTIRENTERIITLEKGGDAHGPPGNPPPGLPGPSSLSSMGRGA